MATALRTLRPPVPAAVRRDPARYVPWLLLAGWFGQVCVRAALGWSRRSPLVYPDEAGYLIEARWLTGGTAADLSGTTFYQPGYALLLAPGHLFGSGTETVYQWAMAVNALVGALAFPLAYVLARRLGLGRRAALALGWAAALLPATTLFGQTALVDGVLPVVVLGWLLALDRAVRTGSPRWAAVAGLLAVYAFSAHMRGIVVLAVFGAVLAGCGWWRRRAAAAGLGAAVLVLPAVVLLNGRAEAALYPDGPKNHNGILIDHLTSLDGQLWAVSGAVGQLWALICGTWGLGGVGLVAVVAAVAGRRTAPADRLMGAALLAVSGGIAYASVAALPDEHRVGNFAYGRYLSCVALVYTVAGLAVLVRRDRVRSRVAWALGLLAASGLWVRLYAGDRLETHTFMGWDFPEIGLLALNYVELRAAVSTTVAAVLLLVLAGAVRTGVVRAGVALAGWHFLAMTVMAISIVRLGAFPVVEMPVRAGGVVIDRRAAIEYRPNPELLTARLALAVDWTRTRWFDPGAGAPGPGVCTAVVPWPAGVAAADTWPERPVTWRYRRAAPNSVWFVLWYDPACPAARR